MQVIKTRKGPNGKDYMFIALPEKLLQQIVRKVVEADVDV